LLFNEFGLDSFVDHNKDERHFFLVSPEALLNLFYLVLLNGRDLLVTNSISKDNHLRRNTAILFLKGFERVADDFL